MLNVYEVLEVSKVLNEFSSYAYSSKAKDRILSSKIIKDVNKILENDAILKEATSILSNHSFSGFTSFTLDEVLSLSKKGGTLNIEQILQVSNDLAVSIQLHSYLNKSVSRNEPHFKELLNEFYNLNSLKEYIELIVTSDGKISDNASAKLKGIRKAIKEKDFQIRERANSLIKKYATKLTELSFSLRDGRFVLPFKVVEKNNIEGILHDISDSGQTCFIEPSELVHMQNEIYQLKIEENEEIKRLLREISERIANNYDEILSNNELISKIDLYFAKARYAIDNKYQIASINLDNVIDIKDGFHPLIDSSKVISNSFYFSSDKRIIILSGPNAGGKTVALKTLALIILLHEMGFPVPVFNSATHPYFERIFVDIGDNQSITDNFSTFSAHIDNLARITRTVGPNDLVILDELGSSTSPKEGSAIALAILNYIYKKGSYAMISSHFDELKQYAYSHDGIENARMIFDEKTYSPTFKLNIGQPGKSYGLLMAKKYHLPDTIIKDASEIVSKDTNEDFSDALTKLNSLIDENEKIRAELDKKSVQLDAKKNTLDLKEEKLNEKLSQIEANSDELIAEMTRKAKEEIDALLNEDRNIDLPKAAAKKKALNEIASRSKKNSKQEEFNDEEINVGDYVSIANLGLEGRVDSLSKNKLNIITSDSFKISVSISDAKKIKEPKNNATKKLSKTNYEDRIKNDVSSELNIIGLRVDEAMDKLDKYLDDCLLRNFDQVRIVHGFGTLALQKATWERLKNNKYVKSYNFADRVNGGEGATVVKFK